MQANQTDVASREFRAVLALNPVDRAVAHTDLAESYLHIVQIRMGSRLDFRVDVAPQLGECDFPPMMLLRITVSSMLRRG